MPMQAFEETIGPFFFSLILGAVAMVKLDMFTLAYLECALWSSTDGNGVPLDQEHTIEDIESNTLGKLVSDCEAFQRDNMGHIIGNLVEAWKE